MIVICARQDDRHARVVQHHLEQRGVPVFIADPRELGAGAELSFWPEAPERTEWRRRDGALLRLGDARAIWHRPGACPTVAAEVSDPIDRRFIAREWSELVCGAFTSSGAPMIDPFEAVLAATKPYSWAIARRAGLAVPETLITNNATRAREFVRGPGGVVHKTLTAGSERALATKRWDESDAPALAELELAPAVFQRCVGGTREVRIAAVGERLFAAELSTTFADGRLDRAATYVAHVLPISIVRALLTLLARLGLSLATIDMRIDARGDYYFLEVSPSGAFLWIEIQTGLPIAAAVADLLCAASQRPRAVPPPSAWWRSRAALPDPCQN